MASANTDRTANLIPWKPGQSGNPNGRPKGIGKRAREIAGGDPDRLLTVLLAIAEDDDAKDSDRIAATREYLDRAWGKAQSFLPAEGDPLELSNVAAAIDKVVDELAGKRAKRTARPSSNGKMAETDTRA